MGDEELASPAPDFDRDPGPAERRADRRAPTRLKNAILALRRLFGGPKDDVSTPPERDPGPAERRADRAGFGGAVRFADDARKELSDRFSQPDDDGTATNEPASGKE